MVATQTGTRHLLTNLYNKTQPLIRYEVTDMLCRAVEPCGSGRPFALLRGIGGRAEDLLRLKRVDGAGEITVAPMLVSLAIESFLVIREYAAEHDPDGIHIQLVIPNPAERQCIVRELPERLRAYIVQQGAVAPPVTLTIVDALDRSAQRMDKSRSAGGDGRSRHHDGTKEASSRRLSRHRALSLSQRLPAQRMGLAGLHRHRRRRGAARY